MPGDSWTDSQATFFEFWCTCQRWWRSFRRPSPRNATVGLTCLGLLLLTKESAAVTFTPFFAAGDRGPAQSAPDQLGSHVRCPGSRAGAAGLCRFGVLLARGPGELARSALLQKPSAPGR